MGVQHCAVLALAMSLQMLVMTHPCFADRRSDSEDVTMFELSGPIGPEDLPATRLTPPASGWGFADFSAVEGTPTVDTSKGVLEVTVNHKPIQGVTPAMVQWLYANLHKSVKLSRNSGKTAPLFQLLHPADHISVTVDNPTSGGLIGVGSTLNWMELPLSGCTETTDVVNMWSCPANRKGFTSSNDPSLYSGRFYTKVTNTVIQSDSSSFHTLKTVDSVLGDLETSFSGHSWSYSNGYLRPSSVYKIGLVTSAGNGDYYLATSRRYLGIINGRVKDAFVNGSPWDARKQGYAMLLHSIQEWQRLPQWLPAVYAANNPTVATAAFRGRKWSVKVNQPLPL